MLSLKKKLYAAKTALNLSDARDYAHRIQDFRRWLVGVIALSYRKDESIAFECGFDSAECSRSARGNRSGKPRKDYCSAKWENGYSLTLCHVFP